jgi:hypothetical protein
VQRKSHPAAVLLVLVTQSLPHKALLAGSSFFSFPNSTLPKLLFWLVRHIWDEVVVFM